MLNPRLQAHWVLVFVHVRSNKLIYFDNGATTLIKPERVSEAVKFAINNLANASRSFYDNAITASREVYKTREAVARLVGLDDPLNVAFTSSATESLNLVLAGLIGKEDVVVTTLTEHNSVLRPLYLAGCNLKFLGCDEKGNLKVNELDELMGCDTKYMVVNHGSNVTGNICDIRRVKEICDKNSVGLIADVSQTLGSVPVSADMADVLCFTGHKSLFGPQGTGGIIVNKRLPFAITKTGGAGVNSFDHSQSQDMPDIFEVGTLNSHGLYGLQKGIEFVEEIGIEDICEKEMLLTKEFYEEVSLIDGIKVYGDFETDMRLPVISLNIDGMASSDLANILWSKWGIATRSGSHCAPLVHEHFGTVDSGMVRFSFSYFNTQEEIKQGIDALRSIQGEK